jgi:hypothetical protein
MANFISTLGLKMDVDIASNLLTGIINATDNFQSSTTSPLAFETAGVLLKQGAVRQVSSNAKSEVKADAFFSPKPDATEAKPKMKSPFVTDIDGTQEKKEDVKVDENNPPDDWLAPKIYKGSTSV